MELKNDCCVNPSRKILSAILKNLFCFGSNPRSKGLAQIYSKLSVRKLANLAGDFFKIFKCWGAIFTLQVITMNCLSFG